MTVLTGRAASQLRRTQIASGKAGLPSTAERTSARQRTPSAGGPHVSEQPSQASPTRRLAAELPAAGSPPAAPQYVLTQHAVTGRDASRARREALARNGKNMSPQAPVSSASPPAPAGVPQQATSPQPAPAGRHAAMQVRASRCERGRGAAPQGRPSGRCRPNSLLQYAPKVAESSTDAGTRVTGVRIGRGSPVTGDEPGATIAVTGTQYLGKEQGIHTRPGSQKVGASRTGRGLVVTGTQVRNGVQITGDESNPAIAITGESDQELVDDLVKRGERTGHAPSQFSRQHDPHGRSVFGANLGRSDHAIGSRQRARHPVAEHTEAGHPISGTAVGLSERVTGDDRGACRTITGNQYLSQDRSCAIAPAHRVPGRPNPAMGRIDPVTGDKVSVSLSLDGSRITGASVEHDTRVTGDEYGACAAVTGTPYLGRTQYEAACDAVPSGAAAGHLAITGDVPRADSKVSGTARGSGRPVSGTLYYCNEETAAAPAAKAERLLHIGSRFSVNSVQRDAQIRVASAASERGADTVTVTGPFALGNGKITGNQEFQFRPRSQVETPGRSRLSGEGRMAGAPLTGGAWTEHKHVTGTEGLTATHRNPSESGSKQQPFAGAGHFKRKGPEEESRQIVTGMVGWSAKSSAKVTLSGGARG